MNRRLDLKIKPRVWETSELNLEIKMLELEEEKAELLTGGMIGKYKKE